MITVYCGQSIEDKCDKQLHPLNEVKKALNLIEKGSGVAYSNSPDFISTIKYVCEHRNVECEFFLNGESTGKDIDIIFADLNTAFDLLNNLIS